jgi:Family of unknown function (DUF5636)
MFDQLLDRAAAHRLILDGRGIENAEDQLVVYWSRLLVIRLSASLMLAVFGVALASCKKPHSGESGTLALDAEYENFNGLPDVSCFGSQSIGNDGSFTEIGEPASLSHAGAPTIEISDVALGLLLAREVRVNCPPEAENLIGFSESGSIAVSENGENPGLGLANLSTLRTVVIKSREGVRLVKRVTAGGKFAYFRIVDGGKGVLSAAERIRLRPKGNRIKLYQGPKLVKPEVVSQSRYHTLMQSLEKTRVQNIDAFNQWLAKVTSNSSHKALNIDLYDIASNDPVIRKGMGAIFDVISNPQVIMRHLQNLEIDIAKRMATKGETMEEALEALLTAAEKRHQFQPAYNLTKLEFGRENFKRPALFRDFFFEAGDDHGNQIHRIQWNVIMRHIDESPELKRDVVASKLFVEFSDVTHKSGPKNWADGWNDLFDSFDDTPGTFGRPEHWRQHLSQFLPILSGWP